MTDESMLQDTAQAIATAIGKRDVETLRSVLAPGFTHRGDNGVTSGAAAFLDAIRGIRGDIVFVHLERVDVDLSGNAAMLTGLQHAQVRIDGQAIDDRRAFADFFVKIEGTWKLRAAADFPTVA